MSVCYFINHHEVAIFNNVSDKTVVYTCKKTLKF